MIPARGGSTRVEGKNLRKFAGRPLIHWSIRNALVAGFSPTVVTDSGAISKEARTMGAAVLKEPPELAKGNTPLAEVARFFFQQRGSQHHIIYLQPTSPLMDYRTIYRAVELHALGKFDSVYSGWPARFVLRDRDGEVVNHPLIKGANGGLPWSKDWAPQWVQDSAVYVLDRLRLPVMSYVIGGRVGVVETDPLRWIDIDTEEDWQRGERLARCLGLA